MENEVMIKKLFPTWKFSIPTQLNLLGNGVGNGSNDGCLRLLRNLKYCFVCMQASIII